jgi:hypothetical protein
MTNKVRYGKNFGLDLDKVIGWKLVPTQVTDISNLDVYIPGDKITFIKGEEGFDEIVTVLSEKSGFQQLA